MAAAPAPQGPPVPVRSTGPGGEPTSPARDTYDVVVVGGGAAGLAAALQLTRCRRSVAVVDDGRPRNLPAAHMHGYLGYDGAPPSALLATGRAEVASYGGRLIEGRVTDVAGDVRGGFVVSVDGGPHLRARRVVLATGVQDRLPDVEGLETHWGEQVIHCPFCHGYEARDQQLVVLATGPGGLHQAQLFRQLSERVAVVLHDFAPDGDDRRALRARGIAVVDGPVSSVATTGGRLVGLRLGSGQVVEADTVVVAPWSTPRPELDHWAELVRIEAPMGMGAGLAVGADGSTSVPGVFAAGNVADLSQQVLQAAAAGARLGAMVNADLVHDEVAAAVAALDGHRPDDEQPDDEQPAPASSPASDDRPHGTPPAQDRDWDAWYRQEDRVWSGHPNQGLLDEVGDLPPGRALDVGCGEGADAVWLAQQGWTVTALDVAASALDRTDEAATAAAVAVTTLHTDAASPQIPADGYELVNLQYPSINRSDGPASLDRLFAAVAPGGHLLVVGHQVTPESRAHAAERGYDPDRYVRVDDFRRRAAERGWLVRTDALRPRAAHAHGNHADDEVLLLRRPSAG